MANILYLVHRLPYPPNKGDKVRSFHLLKHLARSHRIFLGTFVDDPADEVHIDHLRSFCAGLYVARLSPRAAKLKSLRGLFSGEALSLPYYRHTGLAAWVTETLKQQSISANIVFSSVMAQYLDEQQLPATLVDFVDADSAKWTQYAESHRWPMSWVYRREGRALLAYERRIAKAARHSFFVTAAEAALFTAHAPECAAQVSAMANGVDADFFSPQPSIESPFEHAEIPVVFTGAMDYWPNINAVSWFVADILPALQQQYPAVRFYIVGRSPSPAVEALAGDRVRVTGTVADVRPYLQHAAVVAAPLRIARGVQNKVLEAMAMARPVVTSVQCGGAIDAAVGQDFLTAETAAQYVTAIADLLGAPDTAAAMGRAARAQVIAKYSWDAHLTSLDGWLAAI